METEDEKMHKENLENTSIFELKSKIANMKESLDYKIKENINLKKSVLSCLLSVNSVFNKCGIKSNYG
jgi:ABC-type molybdenum transport system ATPase subunit/photorepair protein PhrA